MRQSDDPDAEALCGLGMRTDGDPGGADAAVAGDLPRRRKSRSRRAAWMWTWSVVSAVALAGSFAAGTLVHSPWEGAVQNAGTLPLVTATVAEHSFAPTEASVAGVVSLGLRTDVTPATGLGAARLVVTQTRRSAGDVIMPGSALVDVSGRPILALALPFPLYRDLRPGDFGPDVKAVQNSLKSLGLYPGAADGTFGAATSTAVTRLYIAAGTTPPAPDAALAAAAQAADRALASATTAAATSAAGGPEQGAGAQGAPDLAALAKTRDDAHVAAGAWLPLAETQNVPPGGALVVSVKPQGAVLSADTAVVAVLRTGAARVSARVPVGEADAFPEGGAATVTLTADTTKSGAGTVGAISGFSPADRAVTGSMPGYDVQFELDASSASAFNDGDAVLVGPAAAGKPTTGLAVPLTALREDAAGKYVLVVASPTYSGGKVETLRVDVTAGAQQDGFVQVDGPHLSAGQAVVVGGPS